MDKMLKFFRNRAEAKAKAAAEKAQNEARARIRAEYMMNLKFVFSLVIELQDAAQVKFGADLQNLTENDVKTIWEIGRKLHEAAQLIPKS
jgi:hypothetical protein